MCGIAGTWSPRSERNGADSGIAPRMITEKMVDTLVHRGPDDHGIWVDQGVGFGHRRLKVIDLEGGRQPMSDPDNRVWLVFNGEIYNYQPLRDQLTRLGHSFRTKSDTEVLLYAYLQWGLDSLEHLEGMFAFAVWDRNNHHLHLIRDRLGIKPLFWMHHGNRVYFSSEIKALLQIPGFQPSLNPKGLTYYLSHYQSVMGDETLFQDIYSVEPGTVVTFTDKESHQNPAETLNIHTARYWSLPAIPDHDQEDQGEGYYSAKIRDLLTRSVERQIIADVPLGAYLSGGLDSTILVGLMAELGVKPIKTFSIGFDDSGCNEFAFSQLAAQTSIPIIPKLE